MLTTVRLKGNHWPTTASAHYTLADMPGIAPATRNAMRSKSAGSAQPAPVGAEGLNDAAAADLINKTLAEAAEDGTLSQLPTALAAHYGITDRKGIDRLWRHLGAQLGQAHSDELRREEKRQLDSVQVAARYGTQAVFVRPKKSKKSNRPPAHWER